MNAEDLTDALHDFAGSSIPFVMLPSGERAFVVTVRSDGNGEPELVLELERNNRVT